MRLAVGVALAAILGGIPLRAQFSGRVTGTVLDSAGAAVPGADVELLLAGGKKPLLAVKTSVDGAYHFIGVRPADYDLQVTAKGFMTATIRKIAVDAARETDVPQIKLQLATVTQSIDITAESAGVETSTAEVSGTIAMNDVRTLPLLDRDPLSLLQTQPGVVSNGNSTTVINGLRTSYSSVTVDGINIQDNYIRDNALDYTPNKILMGQVRQMTLIASNGNAATFGGATETAFSTPSGTNDLHGEAFWYNRNNALSANDWFNNQSGIKRPFLNQNQLGGSVGGPIRRDRLFFYANYEAVRTREQAPTTTTILTANARAGNFSYRDTSGTPRTVNLLGLRGLTAVDPSIQPILAQVPGPQFINTNTVGDGLNTGGYRFNMRSNGTRDNVTGKLDYNLSTAHAISGSYSWNRYNSDRPDYENDYSAIPKSTNPTNAKLLALSWRWTPSGSLTNEVRAGFNLTYGYFLNSQVFGPYLLTGFSFSDPINEGMPQGRNTNTYSLSDDAAWQHGRHFVQFGFRGQNVRVRSYDAAGTVPSYGLAMGSGQNALRRTEFQGGITTAALADANTLLATLGGFVDSYSQTLNITGRTSGFVPGAAYLRHFRIGDYDLYAQDKWRISSRLTLTLGLKWQLPGVLDERDSLELAPVLRGSAVQTLLSDATLDFAGKSVGRPYYNQPKRDFAPNIGFAWDVFGNGKTAVRGGYSIHYVNDQEILAPENMLEANGGLQAFLGNSSLSGRVSTGLPAIPVPAFQAPLKLSDNYALDPRAAIGMIDPNLNRPYVQQYSVGIQHDIKGTFVEARYVGNHVVGAYRAFDFNQVEIRDNGFLADFQRAQNNGRLALAAVGTFNPNYNANIPGSQPLTIFPKLAPRILNNSTYVNLIESGQPGELAAELQIDGNNGSFSFFPNPNALAADMITNYSSSSYNSLQLVARRRFAERANFEVNYTFSKVLSDGDGDLQARFQAFLDVRNTAIERSRANFDLNHMIKAFGQFELPFGKGHRLSYRPLDRFIGGWRTSGTMTWQSGAPFSILSGRGTLNRGSRSYYNTASTTLTKSQLDQVVGFRMTGNGPRIVAASAINPADGTGVNGDFDPAFTGQVFTNPAAGAIGVLQRRYFSGPWTFGLDMSLLKQVNLTERMNVEFRADAFNVLNHATFWPGDQNINSTTFGVISSMMYNPRILQFGLYFKF